MLKVYSILVTRLGIALCTVALLGCGQKGLLKLPTDEASRGRATLIESLTPDALRSRTAAPATPATPAPAAHPLPWVPGQADATPLSPPPAAR